MMFLTVIKNLILIAATIVLSAFALPIRFEHGSEADEEGDLGETKPLSHPVETVTDRRSLGVTKPLIETFTREKREAHKKHKGFGWLG